jgi:alcohol dehydrogenase class IV
MLIRPFSVARLPRIEFGEGSLARVPALVAPYGKRALLVTGARSFAASSHWPALVGSLERQDVRWEHLTVEGEPSPQLVDAAVREFRGAGIDVVLGIGGGSVLDAAKAIAGLLRPGNSVLDHLEGVGPELAYRGPATPFIAVPTTAGTGSEATKNAVLSMPGPKGFKKSFRDEQLVAQYAVVDPDLLASCPTEIIGANGMDALTQLMESYVSARANPITDALALSGLAAVQEGLLTWYQGGEGAGPARTAMAYAALISGITLAQTGLGSVHGLASPLGAFFPVPHGVVCGTLVGAATEVNIRALRERAPEHPALEKYACVGSLLSGEEHLSAEEACDALVETLFDWTERLALPSLGRYGITEADLGPVIAHSRGTSMKTNPIALTDGEIGEIVRKRL